MSRAVLVFTVVPFGLCNTLATFKQLMELVLSGLNCKTCLIYLYDVIVYRNKYYDALNRLELVWQYITEANLKLKPSKPSCVNECHS